MIEYSLTILESQFEKIIELFSSANENESAAYLFCKHSKSKNETRFIVNDIEFVKNEDIESRSPTHISIKSTSYVKALSRAQRNNLHFFLLHNHPNGLRSFSPQDDREEVILFKTANFRAPVGPHGSIIIAGDRDYYLIGRVNVDSKFVPLKKITILGKALKIFFNTPDGHALPVWTDRQVRAFGNETQVILSKLHIGVVGAGGTGSSICEQLIRMGVGKLTVIDPQELADTNVTRLYGSSMSSVGLSKATLIEKLAKSIGTGTVVNPIQGTLYDLNTTKELRDCDLIFSCTDDFFGRSILNKLALWYFIPLIDMAVIIDSQDGIIKEITGRVTILRPGSSCLICRNRITEPLIRADALKYYLPDEYSNLVREGYAPELGITDPSVIMFTTNIATRAIMEFMNMLTGYMGNDRTTTEILERYHETETRRNSRAGNIDCACTDSSKWGKGDQDRFLGMNW